MEVLCVGIINNIWGKRGRVKTYENGSTSPLYEICNWTKTIVNQDGVNEQGNEIENTNSAMQIRENRIAAHDPPDTTKLIMSDRAQEFVQDLIDRAKESENESDRFKARVFEYSTFTYKDPRKFSKASGIPYYVCWKATSDFKKLLQQRINDIRINSGL